MLFPCAPAGLQLLLCLWVGCLGAQHVVAAGVYNLAWPYHPAHPVGHTLLFLGIPLLVLLLQVSLCSSLLTPHVLVSARVPCWLWFIFDWAVAVGLHGHLTPLAWALGDFLGLVWVY